MDSADVRELLVHYAILVVLVIAAVSIVDWVVPGLGFWPRLLIAVVVGLVYAPVVRRLGYAPDRWSR